MLLESGISGVLISMTEIEDCESVILALVFKMGLVVICEQLCASISPFKVMQCLPFVE